jgi:hypothetical protein
VHFEGQAAAFEEVRIRTKYGAMKIAIDPYSKHLATPPEVVGLCIRR